MAVRGHLKLQASASTVRRRIAQHKKQTPLQSVYKHSLVYQVSAKTPHDLLPLPLLGDRRLADAEFQAGHLGPSHVRIRSM